MKQHTPTKAANTATYLKLPGFPGHPPRLCARNTLLFLAGCTAVLLLVGCGGKSTVPPVPDMAPLGEGLRVIGYALVASAVVLALGKLLH